VMMVGGLVAWFLAVDAEGKSLEDIATPLAAAGARRRTGSVRAEGATRPYSPCAAAHRGSSRVASISRRPTSEQSQCQIGERDQPAGHRLPISPSPSRSHPAFGSRIDTRRCETAKLVVLRLKTSNNRSYQNLKIGVRLSRYSHGHLAVFR